MTKFVRRRETIGLAKESSAGTPVVPTFWLPVNDKNFDDRTSTVVEEGALGRIEDSDAQHQTLRFAEGDFDFDLRDKEIGLILTSLFGASPVSAGGPTYTHTYTMQNTNTHQSLSIAHEDPNQARIFPYGVVNEFGITVEPEGIATGNVSFASRAAKDWAASAITADFTSLGNKFLHQHLIFKLAATTGALSAASNISLKSLEINISANTATDKVTGTSEPEAILNHQFSVEGTINLNHDDDTYRDYMLDGTYRAMEISLERSATSKLQLQFPRVSFSEWEPDGGLNDIATQDIQFKAHYDAANAAAIISTAILTNTYAGTNY